MGTVKHRATRVARQQQAALTRDRILDAAYRSFVEHGYEATTMQTIADAAGVAVQTVYFRFGTKGALLREVESRAILGNAPRDRWRDTPWGAAILEENDPRRLLELFVDACADIVGRLSPLANALGAALPMDPESIAERERGADDFFGAFVARLDRIGGLRSGIEPRRALDILRVILTVEGYADLTTRRGWTTDEWRVWMTEIVAAQLLEPSSPVREARTASRATAGRRVRGAR